MLFHLSVMWVLGIRSWFVP